MPNKKITGDVDGAAAAAALARTTPPEGPIFSGPHLRPWVLGAGGPRNAGLHAERHPLPIRPPPAGVIDLPDDFRDLLVELHDATLAPPRSS